MLAAVNADDDNDLNLIRTLSIIKILSPTATASTHEHVKTLQFFPLILSLNTSDWKCCWKWKCISFVLEQKTINSEEINLDRSRESERK